MILAALWTIIGFAGLLGGVRNLWRRNANLVALNHMGVNGAAVMMTKLLRNSEILRIIQSVAVVAIGIAAMILYSSSYYQALQAARAAGSVPTPTVVRVFTLTFQIGLFVWSSLLTVNVFYFGAIGDRVSRLRRSHHVNVS